MNAMYDEDHAIVSRIRRLVHEAQARGRVLRRIDLTEKEMAQLSAETSREHGALVPGIFGVRLTIEGHTPDERRTLKRDEREWDAAGRAANECIDSAMRRTRLE